MKSRVLNVSEHAQREVTPALRWRELIAKAGELWLLRKTHNTLFPLTEGRPPHPAWPAPAVHAFSPNSRCVCVCMCVCVCTRACMLSSVQLSVTPWTVACLALLFMGFSRQGYWSRLPCPAPRDLPRPRSEPKSPVLATSTIFGEVSPQMEKKETQDLEGGRCCHQDRGKPGAALRFW